MTPEIIHRIREEQEYYDRNPERYEEEKRQERERIQEEQWEMERQEKLFNEKQNV